jgi:hypothetical protein
MVAGEASRVIRASGRVVVAPTNLATAYPYGGTEVGLTRACVLQPLGTGFRIVSEGLGEATDVLEASNEYVFACLLRGWDDDAIESFFAGGYREGLVAKRATWSAPGTTTPGESALNRALKVLFVPDDVLHVPAVLVYRGVPDWGPNAALAFQRREELGLPLALDCLRDNLGRIVSVGILADLEL